MTCGYQCGEEAVAVITDDAPDPDTVAPGPDHLVTQVGMKVCELHRQNAEHYGFSTRFL